VNDATYTYNFHRNMILAFLRHLDLKNVTLVVQDWGGLLGLTLPVEAPDRFKRLLVMNTALATGHNAGKGFDDWRAYSNANPDMDVAKLMMRTTPVLSEDEATAYSAPFPDINYKAGVRRFPQMVMTEPEMEGVEISKRALAYLRDQWSGESFMAVGMKDPVLGPKAMEFMQSYIRNCPPLMKISKGGHFVQEWGEEIAKAALSHWKMR
jgi:pimeloyl-ACP methyl ester carboxylesterase